MSNLQFTFSALGGEKAFEEAFLRKHKVVAQAATFAMQETGQNIKDDARKSIARAGFKRKWQNAMRANVYPGKGKHSIDAAVYVYHKIPYAHVFEFGARIAGKPYLWVPTKNSPARIGRSKVTPRKFAAQIAPLRSAKGGKRPMLVANYRRGRGRRKKGAPQSVPVFVGIKSARIPKKFNIVGAFKKAAGRVAGLYFKHFKDF